MMAKERVVYFTRDHTDSLLDELWVCCKPVFAPEKDEWVHADDCRCKNNMVVGEGRRTVCHDAVVKYLGIRLKGGRHSITRRTLR